MVQTLIPMGQIDSVGCVSHPTTTENRLSLCKITILNFKQLTCRSNSSYYLVEHLLHDRDLTHMVSSLPQNTARKKEIGAEEVSGLPKASRPVIVGGSMEFESTFFPFHPLSEKSKCSLDQESVTLFCKGSGRQYFQLYNPQSLLQLLNYFVLVESSHRQYLKQWMWPRSIKPHIFPIKVLYKKQAIGHSLLIHCLDNSLKLLKCINLFYFS